MKLYKTLVQTLLWYF